MKKTIISLVIAASFCAVFSTQSKADDYYSYELFTPSPSVPTTVTSILCQDRGYVWLTSLEGLTRLDNSQQYIYLYDEANSRSLPSSSVYQVAADKADNVWVMTEKGVARYCPRTDDFDRFDFVAFSACADASGCYFGQLDTLRKYDYETKTISAVRPLSSDRPFQIDKILPWTSGRFLLFSKERGLLIYDPNSDTIITPPVSLGSCADIFVDSQYRVYIAKHASGFEAFSSNFERLNSYTAQNSGLISNYVDAFAELNGKLVVGTLHGMSIFNPDSGTFTSLKHDFTNDRSLPVNSVISLATDKAGVIYAGRSKGGFITISKTKATEYNITDYGPAFLCPDGLNDIGQFGTDRRIWCATDGSGFASYDPATESFRRYSSTEGMKPVSFARLDNGKLLFFNFPDRFYTFDMSSGAVAPYTFGSPLLDQSNSNQTYETIQGQGSVIFLSSGNSFYAFDSASKDLRSVSIPAGTTSTSRIIPTSGCTSVQYFNNSRYLYKYDQNSQSLAVIYDIGPDVRIFSSAYDGGEHLWMATEDGLADYNVWSNNCEFVTNEFITGARGIVVDKNGKVWISTIYGVFVYNPSSKLFYRLDAIDGVATASAFNPKPCLLSSDGDVYLAGSTHIVRVNSDFSIRPQDQPNIVLESVSVDGEKLGEIENVKIKSTTSDLAFKIFVNEDVTRSHKQYRFKLATRKAENVIVKDQPILELSSTLPGSYDLYASCSTGNCKWSDWQKVGHFSVTTPWYESWWFFALCLLLAIAAFGYLYYIKFPVRKDKGAPEEAPELPAADQARLNSLIGLSHELRTPLTLIMGPLENVLKELPEGDVNEKRLKGVYKQASRMKVILNDFFAGEDIEAMVPEVSDKETSALRPVTPEQQVVPVVDSAAAEKAKSAERAAAVTDQVEIAKEHLETASLASLLPTKEEFTSVVDLKDANILIVEDDIELRGYVRDELKEDVKQVFVAGNGVEAIEVLNRQNVDIIVSDVMMPEMDGFALCRYVKTTVAISHIPVILLTARTDENSRILGYKNGADDYMTKPFELNNLKTSITNLFLSRALVRKRYTTEGAIPDSKETTFSSADENFMNAFEKLVRDNISNAELDMRMLVEGMNMSRTVLYNKVKQLTGMNLQNYVNKCRMEYVIEKMKTTDLPLAEIAEQSGFNSPRYFSTSFKNYTGMTPSQYKKEVIDSAK